MKAMTMLEFNALLRCFNYILIYCNLMSVTHYNMNRKRFYHALDVFINDYLVNLAFV